jgi:hypothetical protein
MDDARIKDVSALLSRFFDENTLKKGQEYSNFLSSWPSIVGLRLAAHSRVADVDKAMLVVEAEHPGWIQLLQMRQSSILEAVSKRFPELGLRGIVFRLVSEGPRMSPSVQETSGDANEGLGGDGAATQESDSQEGDSGSDGPAVLEAIRDPELRSRLQGLKDAMQAGQGRRR